MINSIILTEYERDVLLMLIQKEVAREEKVLRCFPPDDSVWKTSNRNLKELHLRDIKRLLQKLENMFEEKEEVQ